MSLNKLVSGLEQQISSACELDEDVGAFCEFYNNRLEEELFKADGHSSKRLENDDFELALPSTLQHI